MACTPSFFFRISKSFLSFASFPSSDPELLLVLPSRFLLESALSFCFSGDFERDLVDRESLESDLDFLDLLLSSLFDRDFLDRDRERDLDLDLLRFDFVRSCERDFDLLDLDRDLLDLDLERDRLDFEAGDRDRRVFESRLGDLDFFERLVGDLDPDRDFLADLSNDSGDGVRLFFFFPSAMLISLACNLDIATAASGLVLTGIKGIAFSGCGESSRSILASSISFPLSFEFLLGDLETDLLLRLERSRSLCRSRDLLLFLSLSRSLLRSRLRSFDEPLSFSSFFTLMSASSFSFSRSFSFSFSANDA